MSEDQTHLLDFLDLCSHLPPPTVLHVTPVIHHHDPLNRLSSSCQISCTV